MLIYVNQEQFVKGQSAMWATVPTAFAAEPLRTVAEPYIA